MKPRGIPRLEKTNLQESHVEDGCNKGTSKSGLKTVPKPTPLQRQPLLGKGFYLDLPFNKKTETLEKDIKILGGTIEKFFSKDIKYLVSSQKEARYAQSLSRNSPVPSPDSGHSSPHPSSRRGSHKGSSQGPLDTVVTSRGKSLVEKVIKEQERVQINRILSNALEWGIKILYIDDLISYIEKKKRDFTTQQQSNASTPAVEKTTKSRTTEKPAFQKYEAGRISKPFVKVEDCSRHYRPVCFSMPHLPELNFTSAPPGSPFVTEEQSKDGQGKRPKELRNRGHKAAGSEAVKHLKGKSKGADTRGKKRGGYCECCVVKYESVKAHLNSEQHRAFSKSEEYRVVDRAIAELVCDFVEIQRQTKRPRWSFSSVVRTSVPRRKPEGQKEGKVEADLHVEDGRGPLFLSGPPESCTSANVDGAAACRQTDHSRAHLSSSQGSEAPKNRQRHKKPRPVAFQRQPNREYHQTGKEGLDKMGITNSANRSAASAPEISFRLSDGELANKQTHEEGRFLPSLEEDLNCSVPAKSLRTTSSQLEVAQTLANQTKELVSEREHNLDRLNETVGDKSADGMGQHASGAFSPPVPRLQRKVKNFRRRRKANRQTTVQSCKQEDGISCSPPNLWQLFQSSDDMDWEFKGFAD